ncbi:MAG: TerC family protein [Desulfitobacterium hafniense]|nr:TerC family protein [Desulfitobacterium hafniense]
MELDVTFWSSLASIMLINLVLSGDNAVVIALATLRLGEKERKLGIFWGTFGAVALRVVLTAIAAFLLKIPFVQAIGGVLLLWIAVKLLKGEDEGDHVEAAGNLKEAIKIIIFADLLMSLDNVLAVAGAAKGNMVLLILGLVISIPIVIFGSSILSVLMKKFSWIISLGAGLLGYTAGEMILNDAYFHFLTKIHILEYVIPFGLAALVVFIGNYLKKSSAHSAVKDNKSEKST